MTTYIETAVDIDGDSARVQRNVGDRAPAGTVAVVGSGNVHRSVLAINYTAI